MSSPSLHFFLHLRVRLLEQGRFILPLNQEATKKWVCGADQVEIFEMDITDESTGLIEREKKHSRHIMYERELIFTKPKNLMNTKFQILLQRFLLRIEPHIFHYSGKRDTRILTKADPIILKHRPRALHELPVGELLIKFYQHESSDSIAFKYLFHSKFKFSINLTCFTTI